MGSFAYNMDCLEAMRKIPDKYFDLAVVDPPYGGGSQIVHVERERERERDGLCGGAANFKGRRGSRFGGRFDHYHIGGPDGREMGDEVPSPARGCL